MAAFSQTSPHQSTRIGVLPAISHSQPAALGSPYEATPDAVFEQSARALHRQLVATLQAEPTLTVVMNDTLTGVLRVSRAFNPFHADSVRFFAQSLRLGKLLLPSLEFFSGTQVSPRHGRVMLRWLDAASGEVTKFHVIEFENSPQDSALAGFDAHAALQTLLNAPELILTQEQQVALLPALKDLPPPTAVKPGSRRWLWYVSAAALLGGSSAYWLLTGQEEADTKRLLPEPPGPPPR